MALHYQTEYRLGNRGRVCRSYTGFQAFLAIAIDLVFGLLFELVFAAIGLHSNIAVLAVHLAVRMLQLYWRFLVAAMTFVVYAVTLPFVWIHEIVDGLRSRDGSDPHEALSGAGPARKPSCGDQSARYRLDGRAGGRRGSGGGRRRIDGRGNPPESAAATTRTESRTRARHAPF